jgi:carbon-monoxide dehydrogenase large subunit
VKVSPPPLRHAQGIGARLLRKEDARFLTGRGRFIDDLPFADALHCVFVRSPHAHAVVKDISVHRARQAPGVVAVFTGVDMAVDNGKPMRPLWQITSSDGTPMLEPPRWPLARTHVRHVGEPVAVVVAHSPGQALDAAELVEISWDCLPAITHGPDALLPGAVILHEGANSNRCFHWVRGDKEAVDAAMARAAHVVDVELSNNRLCGAAMETRGAVASYDPALQSCILHLTTQAPHHIRRAVSDQLGMHESQLRIVSPDMGGGFGNKGKNYPEEAVLVWASRKLGRTVKWIAQRNESFQSDTQGRDHHTKAQLAVASNGQFLGLRVQTIANLGAYVSTFGANIPSAIYSALFSGVYKTPAIHVEVSGVFTNTVPTDAYRGAGRPEACYVLERLADMAARTLNIDRMDIRQRNMITADEMPYTTVIGPTYDSGDFPGLLSGVAQLSDYGGFEKRRAASSRTGRYRGIGVACFVESSGVAPSRLGGALGARVGFFETAHIRVNPDGSLQASLGTHNHGQGHETTFAQILASVLGIDISRVHVVEGDSEAVPNGTGTFGSRSIAVGGVALNAAAGKIIEKGKIIAAHMAGVDPAAVSFADGVFEVAQSNRRIDFDDIAAAAHAPFDFPHDRLEPGLEATASYDPANFAFSNGAHVAEVEVDIETGVVALLHYTALDDIGTVINPMIAEGQIHGGLAQGIGQVMMEYCQYDHKDGQLLTGSFLDYAVPRAGDMPEIKSEFDESQPCTHNEIGAKGCGESGAIGAPAAIVSAVLDALAPLGVKDIQMPLTPQNIWKTVTAARKSA